MPFIALCGAVGYLVRGADGCAWGVAIGAFVALIFIVAAENRS